jgi:hypothetical protein
VPKGVSSFMFLTRNSDTARSKKAFLFFNSNDEGSELILMTSDASTSEYIYIIRVLISDAMKDERRKKESSTHTPMGVPFRTFCGFSW